MLDEFVDKIKALSDPTRIRILNLLEKKQLCVCEIMQILDLNQSNASNHLNILRLTGFVKTIKKGKWSYYYINPNKEDLIGDLIKLFRHIQNDQTIITDNQKFGNLDKNLCNLGGR